jgi:hypothetical protein
MATILAAVSAVVGAGASTFGAVKQGQAAKKAGAQGPGTLVNRIPSSPEAAGLQSYLARLYAGNIQARPPSFGDYVSSGGTAAFPLQHTGFTPEEARQLGFVGGGNQAIPYYDPNAQTQYTPSQVLFEGGRQAALRDSGKDIGPVSPLEAFFRTNRRIGNYQQEISTGKLTARQGITAAQKLTKAANQRTRLNQKLFGSG